MSLVIVDSGGANLASVQIALQRLGVEAPLTRDPATIANAGRVLLPGVGAAAPVMQRLRESGLIDVLRALRQPLLGICVGMQVLFERLAEGDCDGLGLIPGAVERMRPAQGVRIPHMGWNRLHRQAVSPLLDGIEDGSHAYFVHSFAVENGADCVARFEHGGAYAALVQRGNVAGAQFHPERSAGVGGRLLRNFLSWKPA